MASECENSPFNNEIKIGNSEHNANSSSCQSNCFWEALSQASPLGGRILSQNVAAEAARCVDLGQQKELRWYSVHKPCYTDQGHNKGINASVSRC